MAGTAIILSWNMRISLAGGYLTIVTGTAIVKNVCMIESRPHKRICCEMADGTILSRRKVGVGHSCTD